MYKIKHFIGHISGIVKGRQNLNDTCQFLPKVLTTTNYDRGPEITGCSCARRHRDNLSLQNKLTTSKMKLLDGHGISPMRGPKPTITSSMHILT
jgi:hypothetical protein